MPRRRNVAPRPARRTRRPSPPTASEAERRLLALARELGGLGRDALPRALRALAAAYAPDAPLSRAVAHAFLATRGDKTGALALAWAREQVRLALQELVEATPPSARAARAASTSTERRAAPRARPAGASPASSREAAAAKAAGARNDASQPSAQRAASAIARGPIAATHTGGPGR